MKQIHLIADLVLRPRVQIVVFAPDADQRTPGIDGLLKFPQRVVVDEIGVERVVDLVENLVGVFDLIRNFALLDVLDLLRVRSLFQNQGLFVFLQFADLSLDPADLIVDVGDFVGTGIVEFFPVIFQMLFQSRKIFGFVENQSRRIGFVGVHRFQLRCKTQRVDETPENRDFLFFFLEFLSPNRDHLLRDAPSE